MVDPPKISIMTDSVLLFRFTHEFQNVSDPFDGLIEKNIMFMSLVER